MKKIDLNNLKWHFKQFPAEARKPQDLDITPWSPATVPGSVLLSLINIGQIDEKDFYLNPEKYQHFLSIAWLFKTTFKLSDEDVKNSDKIILAMEGLDTFATIWVNGKILTKTDNSFISYNLNITDRLQVGQNSLMIKFDSAVEAVEKITARAASSKNQNHKTQYRVYARKSQFTFSSDIAPALPGPSLPAIAEIQLVNKSRLSDIHIRTIDCNQHYADIKVDIEIDSAVEQNLKCLLTVNATALKIQQEITLLPGETKNSVIFHIERPFLWWPKGYGIQYLYNLKAELMLDNQLLDEKSLDFGIRTVKLIQEKDDTGSSFQLCVNDKPIKIKGSTYLPTSMLTNDSSSGFKQLLNSAASANINTLRIWGGGRYEPEEFYQLCDKLGLLIWQDFMFCQAQYPQSETFLNACYDEAVSVIQRLRNHCSIILWCGNDQCQAMHKQGLLGKNKKFNGEEIFSTILPKLIKKLDPDRPYIPTTPFSLTKKHNDPTSGTTLWPDTACKSTPETKLSDAPPKFAVITTNQSLPDITTLKKFIPEDKIKAGSYEIDKLNYKTMANRELIADIYDLFGLPNDIDNMIYFSQLAQARSAKLCIEQLRANNINSGSLLWHFNEPFPAVTSSFIDYFKQPKALFYYARRFYQPILITLKKQFCQLESSLTSQVNSADVVIVNDLANSITAQLSVSLMDISGKCIDNISYPETIAPQSISTAKRLPRSFTNPADKTRNFLHFELIVESKVISENNFFFLPDKYIKFSTPAVSAKILADNNTRYIELRAESFIKDLRISAMFQPQDNFIDLYPAKPALVKIASNLPIRELERHFSFKSVNSALS